MVRNETIDVPVPRAVRRRQRDGAAARGVGCEVREDGCPRFGRGRRGVRGEDHDEEHRQREVDGWAGHHPEFTPVDPVKRHDLGRHLLHPGPGHGGRARQGTHLCEQFAGAEHAGPARVPVAAERRQGAVRGADRQTRNHRRGAKDPG